MAVSLAVLSACAAVGIGTETAFVVSRRMELRNTTAKVFRSVGELKNGDKVTVLERTDEEGRSWARLRGPEGQTGWADARFLVTSDVVDTLQGMADRTKDIPPQAVGRSKAYLKLRLTPDRANEDNVVTRLQAGTIFEIIERERKQRPASIDSKADDDVADDSEQKLDEWLRVRVRDNKVLPAGWVFGGSVQLDIPDEISSYPSGGYEIVGWQQIGTVTDAGGRSGGAYLVVEHELYPDEKKKTGSGNEDFNRLKVISWDPGKRDYFMPFRQDLNGKFPLTLKMDGQRGDFQFRERDKNDSQTLRSVTIELHQDGKVTLTGLKDTGAKSRK
ncbi:MAG: SH3 domain-containing protein [Blastocatellia bacterium]